MKTFSASPCCLESESVLCAQSCFGWRAHIGDRLVQSSMGKRRDKRPGNHKRKWRRLRDEILLGDDDDSSSTTSSDRRRRKKKNAKPEEVADLVVKMLRKSVAGNRQAQEGQAAEGQWERLPSSSSWQNRPSSSWRSSWENRRPSSSSWERRPSGWSSSSWENRPAASSWENRPSSSWENRPSSSWERPSSSWQSSSWNRPSGNSWQGSGWQQDGQQWQGGNSTRRRRRNAAQETGADVAAGPQAATAPVAPAVAEAPPEQHNPRPADPVPARILEVEHAQPVCVICMEPMRQGVYLPCAHGPFHRYCLQRCVERDTRCPVCRAQLSMADVGAIRAWPQPAAAGPAAGPPAGPAAGPEPGPGRAP